MSSFHVVYPQPAKDAIKRLHRQAQFKGIADDFKRALITIDEKLRGNGRELGEELRSYPTTKQKIRHFVCYPLVVYWAAHDELNVVFVKDFKLI